LRTNEVNASTFCNVNSILCFFLSTNISCELLVLRTTGFVVENYKFENLVIFWSFWWL